MRLWQGDSAGGLGLETSRDVARLKSQRTLGFPGVLPGRKQGLELAWCLAKEGLP